jgi:hypothetical protein
MSSYLQKQLLAAVSCINSYLQAITMHISTAAQHVLRLLLVCAYIHRGMHDRPQVTSCCSIVTVHKHVLYEQHRVSLLNVRVITMSVIVLRIN